jgi:RNA polymerase sigma-70 factor (ECF subfamily)
MKILRKDISRFSDEQLMELLGTKRCNEALTELHARYGKKVLGFFMRMFKGDLNQSQDFVQELFMRILSKHHQFDSTKRFYSWMFTIASNMCKSEFRKPTNTSISEDGYELNDLASWEESSLDKKVFRSALNEAIESLQVNHKEVFYLRFIEELSVKEIAEVTDVSEGTVKSRIYYATKKVTAQLSEFNPQYDGTIFKMN